MKKPNRGEHFSSEFLDWYEDSKLLLSPKFQRRGVWQGAARSFFIDTLLRHMPVPPIYIRMTQSPAKNQVIREVIDGQQRLTALIEYMKDNFALSKTLPSNWKGKSFSQLSEAERETIRQYSFAAETFQGISDQEVLEIFSRLNTYSVPLNAQELRNGRYFGQFKQFAYKTGYEYLEFWRSNGVFSERAIARMDEVELVSELAIASLHGMQDKKKSIDDYYAKYDEKFGKRDEVELRFAKVMTVISDVFAGSLKETEFHRPPLFYTLYCAVFHRVFGLPDAPIPKKSGALKDSELERLAQVVDTLSDAIADVKAGKKVAANTASFVSAAQRQTDNLKPRTARLIILFDRAFG